ncbi:hypothetical protein [Paractinoplanes atraurantiacus]|uniref:Uncharacterized protein n=1 Tax=Paractinoplanes atraurantiacus TaxID=1036182 RepID=A0A285IYZ8_9ACTN|nr:hypothetical protein [Actinoplanes atraurantiacus]SNY53279.1 hypothetical protein SAMN05421748_113229 [Actinoplanes atraurantiacus]
MDLVVPAALVADVRMPAVAVTDGSPDPEWVDVPLSRWRYRRRPAQRLPVDARTARNVRRYVRLAPLSLPLLVLSIVLLLVGIFQGSVLAFVGAAIGPLWNLAQGPGMPEQQPYRAPNGDLRLPAVSLEVAQEWIRLNPGVTVTDQPAPRPHSQRFYATWAIGLVAAGLISALALPTDGVLILLAPALFIAGVWTATKTAPRLSS